MLALLGWFQLGVWVVTGEDPLPIGIIPELLGADPEHTRSAFFLSGESLVYRMSSLGGEPKHLGAIMVAGLLIMQLYWIVAQSRISPKQLGLYAFIAASAAATVSTTALYLWMVGTIVLTGIVTPFFALGYSTRIAATFTVSAVMLVGVVALVLAIGAAQGEGSFVASVIRTITVEREFGVIEDSDEGILQYLLANPARAVLGSGLGNIHLYADTYLAPVVAQFASGTAFVAKAGYLRILSELGIVGLLILTAAVFYEAMQCRAHMRAFSVRGDRASVVLFAMMGGGLIAVYIAFLAVGTLVFVLYVVLGMAMASRMAAGRMLKSSQVSSRAAIHAGRSMRARPRQML
jgi:hypothetical protein